MDLGYTCDRCTSTIVGDANFNKEEDIFCDFCWHTHFGTIIKYPKQHGNDAIMLAKALSQSMNLLRKDIEDVYKEVVKMREDLKELKNSKE